MTRWLCFMALTMICAGCRAPGNVYAPYGPACVPPPGTGAVGAPYYQAPTYQQPYQTPGYGVPYNGYPAGVAPQYQAPTIQGSTSQHIFPGGPSYAAAPISVSPYMANDGAWSSGEIVSPAATVAAGSTSYARDANREPIQPRASGELIASGARFSHNDDLPWGSRVEQASAALPYASPPSVASATYSSPVRPSVVRPAVIYDGPVQYAAPVAYPNDYVLDPYAATYGPYATESIGSVATKENWIPRR